MQTQNEPHFGCGGNCGALTMVLEGEGENKFINEVPKSVAQRGELGIKRVNEA